MEPGPVASAKQNASSGGDNIPGGGDRQSANTQLFYAKRW